jgi:hypothetical protein
VEQIPDLVGGRHARHLHGHDLQLLDALIEILQEAVVLDRLEYLGEVRRDERALALDLDEQVFAHQLAERLADRDTADLQFTSELVLRGNLQPRSILARGDTVADDLFDLVIQRDDAVLPARGMNGGSGYACLGHGCEHNKSDRGGDLVLLS